MTLNRSTLHESEKHPHDSEPQIPNHGIQALVSGRLTCVVSCDKNDPITVQAARIRDPSRRSSLMAEKPRRRPIFGPLTYVTLIVAALVFTGNRLRPWASAHYRCWSLLRQLRSPNLPDRMMIEESFAQEIHPSTEYWLTQALKDPDPLISQFARELDLKLHEGSPRTILALKRSLDSGDPLEIPTILQYVEQMPLRLGIRLPLKERRELVKTIISLLDRNDPLIRKAAAQSLASFAVDLDLSHDRLHEIAKNDNDLNVRMQALSTIVRIDRDQNHRVKALLDEPLDPDMPQD